MASTEPDTDQNADEDREQGLISHLLELRTRLLKSVLAFIVLLLVLVPFANRLYTLIAEPLIRKLPAGAHMIAIEVASPFLTPLKLVAMLALLLAMPVVLYQLWAFVSPGLYRHEKRLARPLLVAAVGLFFAGCAFAYFLVLPNVFRFLTMIVPQGVEMMTDISHYLSFVLMLLFAFGLCFEVPVAVVVLVAIGVVDVKTLSSARGYVLVGCFVVAAILTPPDVLSQIMLALPMYALFEAGVLASKLLLRSRQKATTSD